MKEPQNSSVAPMKPVAIKPGGRGPPTEEKRSPVTSRPTSNRVRSSVPTTLEGAFNFDGEGRNVHEILGILVEAQEKEAYAILGRTNVNREDVVTVADIFQLAKHGIGGDFDEPQPFIGEWALTILRTLPSVGGKSRDQFVEAWQNAQREREKALADAENRARRIGG